MTTKPLGKVRVGARVSYMGAVMLKVSLPLTVRTDPFGPAHYFAVLSPPPRDVAKNVNAGDVLNMKAKADDTCEILDVREIRKAG